MWGAPLRPGVDPPQVCADPPHPRQYAPLDLDSSPWAEQWALASARRDTQCESCHGFSSASIPCCNSCAQLQAAVRAAQLGGAVAISKREDTRANARRFNASAAPVCVAERAASGGCAIALHATVTAAAASAAPTGAVVLSVAPVPSHGGDAPVFGLWRRPPAGLLPHMNTNHALLQWQVYDGAAAPDTALSTTGLSGVLAVPRPGWLRQLAAWGCAGGGAPAGALRGVAASTEQGGGGFHGSLWTHWLQRPSAAAAGRGDVQAPPVSRSGRRMAGVGPVVLLAWNTEHAPEMREGTTLPAPAGAQHALQVSFQPS